MKAKYVLIGNSAAALAALDWIRKHDRSGLVFVLNAEKGPAYSRVALPYFVSGQMTMRQLLIRRTDDYSAIGAQLVEGAPVVGIDPDGRSVELADGRCVEYERLLIGTGSVCKVPPIQGLESIRAHYLWTLDDAVAMKAAAEKARRAVIIGGGFIGMLAAEALRKLNVGLTVVEMADQLLPQLLDAEGGRRFLRAVTATGVDVCLGARVQAVGECDESTRVTLAGGETLATDMVVVAAGVKPNLSAVASGSCATGRGILVDDHLRTDRDGVYAAGDVAEAREFLTGEGAIHAIWPTAVEQGRIAGANMAGARMRYAGSLGMNVVELFGVTLAQVGRFREQPGDDVELLGGAASSVHRKVVLDGDGRMVGAMYLGDANGVAEMGVIQSMIKRRAAWREVGRGDLPRVTYATQLQAAQHG